MKAQGYTVPTLALLPSAKQPVVNLQRKFKKPSPSIEKRFVALKKNPSVCSPTQSIGNLSLMQSVLE
jgi:hypothetical protein